jgi:putative oxidoreductase
MATRAYPYLHRPGDDPAVVRFPFASPSIESPWPDRALSVLRIVAALLYVEHGLQKLINFPPAAHGPMPFVLGSLFGAAGVIETVGGILLFIGLLTRPVAFITCGEMAVAYFKVHFPRSVYPINNMGETPVLLCFIFLLLIFAGAGPWSIDALIAKRRSPVNIRA